MLFKSIVILSWGGGLNPQTAYWASAHCRHN